jgi:sorbitol-specific phosphotransferase system component IIC
MKLKHKIYQIAIAGAFVLSISSCKKVLDNLADLNKDENQPLTASSATLLTSAEFGGVMLDQGSFISSGPSLNADGDGFFGIFNGHMAGNHAEGVDFNQYILKHGDFQFLFNDAYVSSLKNLQLLIANVRPDETQAYVGVAEVLQAYQLGYLTTVYGAIPWSQALDILKYPHPKYDAQTDIYTTVQALLNDGIQRIKTGGTVNGDVIYKGDLDKWISTAYLLRARYYNHFSKKDPSGSAASALLMVDSAKLAGFATNGDAGDFKLPYANVPGTSNPWYGMYSNGMLVANEPFLDSMIAQNDPRLNAYFSSINGIDGSDVYGLGKVISGNVGTGAYMLIGPDAFNYFGNATSSILLATYPELLMIEAEAALRAGDPGRAATAHNAAITAHINEMLSLPKSQASDKLKVAAYLATYASETAGTITLGKVMTEKHKLMFTMEAESWMDVRRMNYAYPSWLSIPVVDETVASPVPVASSFIQRILYPQSELDKNAANVPAATIFDKLPILQ